MRMNQEQRWAAVFSHSGYRLRAPQDRFSNTYQLWSSSKTTQPCEAGLFVSIVLMVGVGTGTHLPV